MTETYLGAFGLKAAPFSKEMSPTAISAHVLGGRRGRTLRGRLRARLGPPPRRPRRLHDLRPRAVRARLPESGYRLTYCHNATLGRRDFNRQICLALGLSPKATAAAVFYSFSTHVQDPLAAAHRPAHAHFLAPIRASSLQP